MNTLTTILLVIAILIGIVLIVAAFLNDSYTIEKEITINKPKTEVFNYIKLLKNQVNYSKWMMTDPNARLTYRGIDGNVGSVIAWDSDNKQVGKGEQETTRLLDGERVDCEIRFEKPFEGKSTTSMVTTKISQNETKVQWFFKGDLNYMMKLMHLILNLKKGLGKDLQTSLNNLKSVFES
jgi:uncharacterized protein YndB with AHSA1/START domain